MLPQGPAVMTGRPPPPAAPKSGPAMRPVRAENRIHGSDQHSCSPGALAVMLTGCLRFVFVLITRLAAWLRLSRREEAWKTAQILILRHQVAVLQRRQPRRPKLNWADRPCSRHCSARY